MTSSSSSSTSPDFPTSTGYKMAQSFQPSKLRLPGPQTPEHILRYNNDKGVLHPQFLVGGPSNITQTDVQTIVVFAAAYTCDLSDPPISAIAVHFGRDSRHNACRPVPIDHGNPPEMTTEEYHYTAELWAIYHSLSTARDIACTGVVGGIGSGGGTKSGHREPVLRIVVATSAKGVLEDVTDLGAAGGFREDAPEPVNMINRLSREIFVEDTIEVSFWEVPYHGAEMQAAVDVAKCGLEDKRWHSPNY